MKIDITIVTSQQNEGELNDYTANTYSKLNPGTVIKYYTPPQGFLGVVDLIPQLYEENVLTVNNKQQNTSKSENHRKYPKLFGQSNSSQITLINILGRFHSLWR